MINPVVHHNKLFIVTGIRRSALLEICLGRFLLTVQQDVVSPNVDIVISIPRVYLVEVEAHVQFGVGWDVSESPRDIGLASTSEHVDTVAASEDVFVRSRGLGIKPGSSYVVLS